MTLRTRLENVKRIARRDGYSAVLDRLLRKCAGKLKRVKKIIRRLVRSKPNKSEILKIAFYPTGGLGDYIISAKVLEELLNICRCDVNVYCEKYDFGEAIYGSRENVIVEPFDRFDIERYDCDLALTVEHFIHIKNIDWLRIKELSTELYKRLSYLKYNWNELYVDIPQQHYRELVHFKQCKLNGLNRWTELRMGKTFDISNQRVTIPVLSYYECQYNALPFAGKRFITMNCGTDAMRNTGIQTKAWPNSYYEKLAELIKQYDKCIGIVQLGDTNGDRLENMDYHVMGKSLELVKWILMNSILHIDIEGGLVHLATQLDTKCAVIFGPTPMHMYAYEQNENICNSDCFACMGCDEDWAYKCYKGCSWPQCMTDITPEIVFEHINKYIKE